MTAEIGHNGGPTFDDVVRENMDRGLLLSMKEVIVQAVRDPRLDRRHLRVLAEVIDHINRDTGTSYPGHKAIAASLRRYNVDGTPDQGYSDQGIRNTLSDLVNFGYLVSARMAAEKGGRAMAHYTICKPPKEDLQGIITEWIMAQRTAPARPHPVAHARRARPDVTSQPDVISQTDVTQGDDIRGGARPTSSGFHAQSDTSRQPDVISQPDVTSRPDVTSDVTSPVAPVTNTKELGERTEGHAATVASKTDAPSSLPPLRTYPAANGGEVHRGHGVYLNGETIRHPAFAISLEGIRMGTLASGLASNEVTEVCLLHALQWAVEIENGSKPDKVLPSKIANFLSRSIMGGVNQQRSQKVREARDSQPYAVRNGAQANSPVDGVTETRAQRLERMAIEIERKGQNR